MRYVSVITPTRVVGGDTVEALPFNNEPCGALSLGQLCVGSQHLFM
jgi:hypothetical protein